MVITMINHHPWLIDVSFWPQSCGSSGLFHVSGSDVVDHESKLRFKYSWAEGFHYNHSLLGRLFIEALPLSWPSCGGLPHVGSMAHVPLPGGFLSHTFWWIVYLLFDESNYLWIMVVSWYFTCNPIGEIPQALRLRLWIINYQPITTGTNPLLMIINHIN